MNTLPAQYNSVTNGEPHAFQHRQCAGSHLRDVKNYLMRIYPKSRFNEVLDQELAELIYNLKTKYSFEYCVGGSHSRRKRIRDKMRDAGLMKWDSGFRLPCGKAELSEAKATPLFFAVIECYCQIKQSDGTHIGYWGDLDTLKELMRINQFLKQNNFAIYNGDIDSTQRFNYLVPKGGSEVVRQRLISPIQNKKKHMRCDLTINGEETAGFDVTATHLQIALHAFIRKPMDFDPYAIVDESHEDYTRLRTAAKLAVMMMLNTTSRKAAGAAFCKELREPGRTPVRKAIAGHANSQIRILDMVHDRNPLLQQHFYRKACYKLMHIEGNIAWDFMRRLTERGIPTLSIHDEFIVPKSRISQAIEIFNVCWADGTGTQGKKMIPRIALSNGGSESHTQVILNSAQHHTARSLMSLT